MFVEVSKRKEGGLTTPSDAPAMGDRALQIFFWLAGGKKK